MTHYYFDGLKNELSDSTHPKAGNGIIELTHQEYMAACLLLLSEGGYHAFMSAAYKCGVEIPQSEKADNAPEYAIGYCGACTDDKLVPVRLFSHDEDYYCKRHYEAAVISMSDNEGEEE